VLIATAGLIILSWPQGAQIRGAFRGALLGLASGAAFAVALNAYRQAGLALEPAHPIYAGTAGVCVAQAMQSLALTVLLAIFQPAALSAVAASSRRRRLSARSASSRFPSRPWPAPGSSRSGCWSGRRRGPCWLRPAWRRPPWVEAPVAESREFVNHRLSNLASESFRDRRRTA
jgi:hypothetical protein